MQGPVQIVADSRHVDVEALHAVLTEIMLAGEACANDQTPSPMAGVAIRSLIPLIISPIDAADF
jgi:hypothetical protein